MPNYALLGLQQASQPPIGNPVPGSALLDPEDMNQDPLIRQRLIQSRLNDELKDRINTELAAPDAGTPGRLSALKNMLGQTQEDLGEPGTAPTTPLGIQAQQVRATNASNFAAQQQGFPSAVEQAKYSRLQEALKAQQPLEIEKERAKAQVEAAKQQGTEAEKLKEQGDINFMGSLRQQYPQGPPPGTTIRGRGGIEIARAPGSEMMPADVAKTIDTLEKSKWNANMEFIPAIKSQNAAIQKKIDNIKAQFGLAPTPSIAEPQPTVPTANRITRPLKSGGTAYSDDGGKTWFTDSQ